MLLSLLLSVFVCGTYSFLFEGVWSNEMGESIEIQYDEDGGLFGTFASIVKPRMGLYDLKGSVDYVCLLEENCFVSFSVIWHNEYTLINSASSWIGMIKDGELNAWRTTATMGGGVEIKKDVFKQQKLINIFESFM